MKKVFLLLVCVLTVNTVSAQTKPTEPVERLPVGEAKETLIQGSLVEYYDNGRDMTYDGYYVLGLYRSVEGEVRDITTANPSIRSISAWPPSPLSLDDMTYSVFYWDQTAEICQLYVPVIYPWEGYEVPSNFILAVRVRPEEPMEASLLEAIREKSQYLLDFYKEYGDWLGDPAEPGEIYIEARGASFYTHRPYVFDLVTAKTPAFTLGGSEGDITIPEALPEFEFTWGREGNLRDPVPVATQAEVTRFAAEYEFRTVDGSVQSFSFANSNGLLPNTEADTEGVVFVPMYLLSRGPEGRFPTGMDPEKTSYLVEYGVTLVSGTVTLTTTDGDWVYDLVNDGELIEWPPGWTPTEPPRLAIMRSETLGSGVIVQLQALDAGTYIVQAGESMDGPWQKIATVTLSEGESESFEVSEDTSMGFYRALLAE